eukprot:CAMPEP_0119104936 /NCGR_PEP_ID=MMETSP1180-20130426/3018_1 /TAXON_ID=3052 ORGANISM="Chlamydomonas cf sp, Strain CCMP681" /NCGR_SAMPLE_ID=MMETSP1180 /ASSEMBLY_ACC=CAM_ASM_000741 /LENGTH=30 /DNA_ID= /DNA_START= /DNA_END= /DNA_ORIENTATION=
MLRGMSTSPARATQLASAVPSAKHHATDSA